MEHPVSALLRTLYVDRFSDPYSAWPLRAVSYCRGMVDALGPLAPRWVTLPGTALTLSYGFIASRERSVRAASLERHPELVRKAGVSAGFDSALTMWLECVTLPGIACGAVHRGVRAALPASPPAAQAVVALAMLPLVLLPACSQGADLLMQWSLRPAIARIAQPSEAVYYGSPQYVPPLAEELEGSSGGLGNGSVEGLRALIPSDMDELSRKQLEWALDGKVDSIYPESVAVAEEKARQQQQQPQQQGRQ